MDPKDSVIMRFTCIYTKTDTTRHAHVFEQYRHDTLELQKANIDEWHLESKGPVIKGTFTYNLPSVCCALASEFHKCCGSYFIAHKELG